ncbi:MAG TPA: Uma2 family endonuclease [Isosphaeraceae bacterium]|jgi:Uma2 family endonuclease
MPKMLLPPGALKRLLRKRRAWGGDRYDEVWNGVYVLMPMGDNQHQEVGYKLTSAIDQAMGGAAGVRFFAGTNVSDRKDDWRKNFRCPDVAVFLPGNPAEDRETHWFGGPDFAVEIASPYDRSRQKFAFYAKVGVREVMLVGRNPWYLELHRWSGTTWDLVGRSDTDQSAPLASSVLPVSFRLLPDKPRPRIEVTTAGGHGPWIV